MQCLNHSKPPKNCRLAHNYSNLNITIAEEIITALNESRSVGEQMQSWVTYLIPRTVASLQTWCISADHRGDQKNDDQNEQKRELHVEQDVKSKM